MNPRVVCVVDRSLMALTPSYESDQSARYAEGDYDAKFDRIVIVREGDFSELNLMFPLFKD